MLRLSFFLIPMLLFFGKTNAQFSEYSNVSETSTGVYGSIAHETANDEVFDKKDFSSPTYGFIKNGATFELLNLLAVKHPKFNSLPMILIRVTSDPENKYVGKTGWVHVKATTLNKRFNANSLKIENSTASNQEEAKKDYSNYEEKKTGLFGTIDNSTGKEVLDKKNLTGETYGFLQNGATFDLLNFKSVKHPVYNLDMILIRVTHDPENKFTGKVGWVYVNATSLKNNFNSVTLSVESKNKASSNTSQINNSKFANYKEWNTNIYGSIAHESEESEVFDKKDFTTPTWGFIKNGATFDLLNTQSELHPDFDLDMILIRVTFDPDNKFTGKTGWVHINATSLKNRFSPTSRKIE